MTTEVYSRERKEFFKITVHENDKVIVMMSNYPSLTVKVVGERLLFLQMITWSQLYLKIFNLLCSISRVSLKNYKSTNLKIS
jgi:hypothetical protein